MAEKGRNNIGEILKSEGYSKSAQKSPTKVTKTKGFQIAQSEVLEELRAEEIKVFKEMEKKRRKATYGMLATARAKLREQAWEAEDRLKAGGRPEDTINVKFH